jgi:dihydropyrimidinase
MVDRGFTTFKEFMIYESEGWQSDDRALFGTLERMREYGTMLLVHAESARVLDELIARHHTPELMARHGARLHPMTRPNFVEAEAIQRVVQWCEATGGQLYIVHMSTAEGSDIVRSAQARGVPVLAETCAQYLVLDDSVFDGEDGHLFACCPQVKKPRDVERLWRGLRDGEVSVVSTDTCTFTREQKAMWNGDWTKIPMGLPGLETLLPLVYTQGVLGGRLTLEELSLKLSTNPARIMGLYPRKGAIVVGADADLAIIHPTATRTVSPATMETNADWSPYDGWELAGFARTTLSRGEVIVDRYAVVGREGRGQWLPRTSAALQGSRTQAAAPAPPVAPSAPRPRAARPAGAR